MAFRKSYHKNEWQEFSNRVKQRDGYKCLKCGRGGNEVVLQAHHKLYKPGLEIWDYPLSDCITLCKGCHAVEHGIVEPSKGWTLVSIDDLGDLIGQCERRGCGNDIRYEHVTYHPLVGYKSVGSTCVQHLTEEDQDVSKEVMKVYRKISEFIRDAIWNEGMTQNGKAFHYVKCSRHVIRIYGSKPSFSVQILMKYSGSKHLDFGGFIRFRNKNL